MANPHFNKQVSNSRIKARAGGGISREQFASALKKMKKKKKVDKKSLMMMAMQGKR